MHVVNGSLSVCSIDQIENNIEKSKDEQKGLLELQLLRNSETKVQRDVLRRSQTHLQSRVMKLWGIFCAALQVLISCRCDHEYKYKRRP